MKLSSIVDMTITRGVGTQEWGQSIHASRLLEKLREYNQKHSIFVLMSVSERDKLRKKWDERCVGS